MYFLVETNWKLTWSLITGFLLCLDVCAWLLLILLPHPLHCTCLRITCIVLNCIVLCCVVLSCIGLYCIALYCCIFDTIGNLVLLVSWYFCLHRGYWYWFVAILHVEKNNGYKTWSYGPTTRTPRLRNFSNASMPPFPPCSIPWRFVSKSPPVVQHEPQLLPFQVPIHRSLEDQWPPR